MCSFWSIEKSNGCIYMSLHKLVHQKFKATMRRNAVEDDGSHLKPINISFEGALTTMYFNGPKQDHYLPLNRYHHCRAPSIYGLKKIMSMWAPPVIPCVEKCKGMSVGWNDDPNSAKAVSKAIVRAVGSGDDRWRGVYTYILPLICEWFHRMTEWLDYST
jgi:hypothetical protein